LHVAIGLLVLILKAIGVRLALEASRPWLARLFVSARKEYFILFLFQFVVFESKLQVAAFFLTMLPFLCSDALLFALM